MNVEVTDEVSVVRITGSGKCFSAGVDLRAVIDGGRGYTERFLDYPGPVVAAINGHAIAGGCVVAVAADVRPLSEAIATA